MRNPNPRVSIVAPAGRKPGPSGVGGEATGPRITDFRGDVNGIIFALALLAAASPAQAAAAPLELRFEDAVRMAGEKPASVVITHERVQQAIARLAQTRAGLWPQLTASASESRQTRNLAA